MCGRVSDVAPPIRVQSRIFLFYKPKGFSLLYISVSKPLSSSSLYIPGSMPVLNGTSGELSPGCSTCSIPTTHCSTNTHLIPAFLFMSPTPLQTSSLVFSLLSLYLPLIWLSLHRNIEMICIHADVSSCSHALRSLAKMAGELLDLRNTSPRLPLSNLICHINTIPLALPSVIVVSIRQRCVHSLPTLLSMDIFQSWCPAKASLRLLPLGFPAGLTREDNTNALRHFYYEKIDGGNNICVT